MRGVGDQVALGGHRLLERVERAVKAGRQAHQLGRAGLLQALGAVKGPGDLLGAPHEAPDRGQGAAAHQAPQGGGQQDPAAHQQTEREQQAVEHVVDLAQGAGHLDRGAVVGVGDGQHAQVRAAHRLVGQVATMAALGGAPGAGIDR